MLRHQRRCQGLHEVSIICHPARGHDAVEILPYFYYRYEIDPILHQYVAKNVTIMRVIRECCDGYIGEECNERINVPESVICGNLTCEEDPNAYCAVVRKCGREIPIFLDEKGLPSKKCNQTVDLESFSCSGVCTEDPCSNAQCIGHPTATCFPIGCECKAVWLVRDPDTGESIEVNCGDSAKVRPKRDAACNS